MAVEESVDHRSILMPLVTGIRRGMDPHETAAGFDELHQVLLQSRFPLCGGLLLPVRHRFQFIRMRREDTQRRAQETDGIISFQTIGLELVQLLGDHHLIRPGLTAHLGERKLARGDRRVAEAVGFREHEQFARFLRFRVSFVRQGFADFLRGARWSLLGGVGIIVHHHKRRGAG